MSYLESNYELGSAFASSALASKKYANGQVVRLITPANRQYQATIYPSIATEALSIKIEDPDDGRTYTMEIQVGSHSSNIVTLSTESTSTDEDIDRHLANMTELTKSYLGANMYYVNFSCLVFGITEYPLPQ